MYAVSLVLQFLRFWFLKRNKHKKVLKIKKKKYSTVCAKKKVVLGFQQAHVTNNSNVSLMGIIDSTINNTFWLFLPLFLSVWTAGLHRSYTSFKWSHIWWCAFVLLAFSHIHPYIFHSVLYAQSHGCSLTLKICYIAGRLPPLPFPSKSPSCFASRDTPRQWIPPARLISNIPRPPDCCS